MEDNKLIAEFMGYDYDPNKKQFNIPKHVYVTPSGNIKTDFSVGELKFHKDWNWLMEVVEKIESKGYGVTIGMGEYCVIQNDWEEDLEEIYSLEENGKLLCTYGAVVEFIKWYNKRNNV